MKFEKNNLKAVFLNRLNRFEAIVLIDGEEELVHVPNTGRCRELLFPGATVILEDRTSAKRKTKYELIMVYKDDRLVSIDSQLPNKLAEEAIRTDTIKELKGYSYIKREATYSGSRFDLFLRRNESNYSIEDSCFVEVKGVTLERNRTALFPDAPTERGTKHINELIKAHNEDYRAVIMFVVQLDFADLFIPNCEMDPKFGDALRLASQQGVEILAYACSVTEKSIAIVKALPVRL